MHHLEVSRLLEQHIDHNPLRRRQDHGVDPLLPLHVTAVAADELHPSAGERDVEHAGVGGVDQVEAQHLPEPCGHRLVGLAVDEDDVAEPAHGRVGGLVRTEPGDLAVLEKEVVEGEQHLAVHGGPVARLGSVDHDAAVQPHLDAVVGPDVRVVPVDARVGEGDHGGEALPDLDRRLGLVRAVVPVLEPEAVPVHGGLHIALVLDVDHDLRALPDPEDRAWDRSVVGEHPHPGATHSLGDRRDA